MKYILAFLSMLCLLTFSKISAKVNNYKGQDAPLFKENKGQILDQNNNLRSDILFSGTSDGLSYFFRKNGISYQLYQPCKEKEVLVSRIDMTWVGANLNAKVLAKNRAVTTDNFYNIPNNKDGITGVNNYCDIKYENIYNDIDLHYYYKNGSLKYDFIVAPNADYKNIKIKVEGATSITRHKDGTISILTPSGTMTEGVPVAYQSNKEIRTSWVLENNILSFNLSDYDPALPLIIDPLVYKWRAADSAANVLWNYGVCFSSIANDNYGNTYGVNYQTDDFNSYVIKYDANGEEIWKNMIYGGGASGEETHASGCSLSGNFLYVCGTTFMQVFIATVGAYQTVLNDSANTYFISDCFLMKYDSSGVKLWGTYYGGYGDDGAKSCKTDAYGNVFLCGWTQSQNNMTYNAFQSASAGSREAFIAKFDANGFRKWSTYFGGNNIEEANSIDINGNRLFVAGSTRSSSGIATPGAFQTTFSGYQSGFLLCMDTVGTRQWSTYYGGDTTSSASCVASGNFIYMCGATNATSGIATSGTFQSTKSGGNDGFLSKFDVNGVRQWGTYFGGTNNETADGNAIGSNGNIYMCGSTKSSSGIAIPSSFNPNYVVNSFSAVTGVAYLAELDTSGQRISSTYYNRGNCAKFCSTNSSGDVSICGMDKYSYLDSTTNIWRTVVPAYIVKFGTCNDTTPSISATATNICGNGSTQISTPAITGATYGWFRNDTLIVGATNNTYTTAITGNYRVQLNSCPTGISVPIAINVYPAPVTSITKTDAPCATATTGSINVMASGGTPPYLYNWDNSPNTTNALSGLVPGAYVVHTSDANACIVHDTVVIADTNNSPITQVSVANVPCYGTPVGSIEVTASGGIPPYSYIWDNSTNTTASLTGILPGNYVVHTIDANTCEKVDSVNVPQDTTIAPSDPLATICAVTVDSATSKNLIIWEKNGIVKATAYNIYRESSVAGQYNLIGTNFVDDFSTFLDGTSIPLQQSYSYKIAEIDSCGHEWPQSEYHETIHLSASVGINGEVNLNWNIYQGKPYSTHYIMRSFNGGPFILLNEVSSTITSYSDLTPPVGISVYRIEIDLGMLCAPSKPTSLQLVQSNSITLNPTAINNTPSSRSIHVVPNPTTGVIYMFGDKSAKVRIYDATGRILMDEWNVGKLDISKYSKGFYMIHLLDESGKIYCSQKIILQ